MIVGDGVDGPTDRAGVEVVDVGVEGVRDMADKDFPFEVCESTVVDIMFMRASL